MDKIEVLAKALHAAFIDQGRYVTDLPTREQYDEPNPLFTVKHTTIDGEYDLRVIASAVLSAIERLHSQAGELPR
jgi:hypothetical protein